MTRVGRYDSELQMFVREDVKLNWRYLQFLKKLVEQGKLEEDLNPEWPNAQWRSEQR